MATEIVEKIEAPMGLYGEFDEYRVGRLKKEISTVERKLKKANSWDGTAEDISRYKEV